jgi:hypothetical protein
MSISDVFSTLMKVRRVVAIVSIIAGAGYKVAPMVWHKVDAKPALAGNASTNSTANKASGCNLGAVSLTNHYETCVQLGAGQACILTPKMLDSHNVQLTVAVESKTALGKIHDLSVTQVITRSGRPFEVAVGNFNLSLTPNVITE